jgi:uncharacterized membrane protein
MNTTERKIEEIKTNGYNLDFGTVFNNAFENYKKIAVYGGLAFFVFSAIMAFAVFIVAITIFGISASSINPQSLAGFKLTNFSSLFIVSYILGVALFTAIITPFMAGFLKMADSAQNNQEFAISDLFSYYKSPYFLALFTGALLISLVGVGLSMLIEFTGIQPLGLVFSLMISFFTFLYIPLIIFGNLNAIEAIKGSFILVTKQPVIILGLIVVAYIGSMVGFIGCCIGIFFTLPFMYSMHYTIYCAIMGTSPKSELDEIGAKFD